MSTSVESAWKKQAALFLTSQTFSLLGTSLVQYALMWHVTLSTKSGLIMTIYILCGFVPTFLVSPFGGVWADRFDRKKLIIFADGFIALATLTLAIVFMMGEKTLWLIFLTAAIRAVGTAIQGPAVGAILPQFIPTEHLTRINGVSGSIQSVIMLVAPIASGAMMAIWPMHIVFFIDVVTAAIAILILLFLIKIPPHKRAAEKITTSHFSDMKMGFEYISNHKYLVTFFLFSAILLFLIAPASFLTPLQVARTFGSDVWRLTAIEIVFSVGMMLGGGLLALWSGFKNRILTMLLAAFVMSLCTLFLGISQHFPLYLIFMGLFGLALIFYQTPSSVLIQEHVEESYLGRVYSVMTMMFTSVMPLGMLLFGPLAEIIKIETILIVTGALMMLLILIMTRNKNWIKHGTANE